MKTNASIFAAAMLILGACLAPAAEKAAPAGVFDLRNWKLQIPGPAEVKVLGGYSADYFCLNAAREMCFHLDAAEKGATANAHYVRSELRHMPNWKTSEAHTLSGEFRVVPKLTPDKVTAMQIHGINEDGSDAPPLLRIAVNNGDLVAVLKSDNEGDKSDTIVLKKAMGGRFVKVDVSVRNKQLKITVDNEVKLTRSLAFWKYLNYFKAGCYPQATKGTVDVFFRKLTVQ
ncbi:MAG: polysaccharide lyase family 7 protein [Chthoniobacteraceae bacterium]